MVTLNYLSLRRNTTLHTVIGIHRNGRRSSDHRGFNFH